MLAEVGQALTTLLVMSWRGHVQRTGDVDGNLCFGLGALLPAVLCGSVFLQCAKTLVIRKAADIIYLKSPLLGNGTGRALEKGLCCFCFVGRLFITGNNFGFLRG